MLALVLVLAVLVGISLGLLGGGGSILAVPLLAYVAGLPPREAIATSLLVVGGASTAAMLRHAVTGRVRWRTGLTFGPAAMVGAFGGGRLAQLVSGELLLLGFAVLMLVTAVAMVRGRSGGAGDDEARRRTRVWLVLVQGAAVGLVTGLLGAGGGFLIVPALVLLGGMQMGAAVGTSLFVIALNSFAGFAGHLPSVELDLPFALAVTGAAVVGSLVGGSLTGLLRPQVLRRFFGWFVVAMGMSVLGRQSAELLDLPWYAALGVALLAGLLSVAAVLVRPPSRRSERIGA